MVCCFFGHKDTPESIKPALAQAIEDLIISKGVDSFLVGNKGAFDAMSVSILASAISNSAYQCGSLRRF